MPFGFISFLDLISLRCYGRPSNTFNNISIEIFKAEVVYSFQLLLYSFLVFSLGFFSCITLVCIVYSMYPFMCAYYMHTSVCLYKYTHIPLCLSVCRLSMFYVLCYTSMYVCMYVSLHRVFKSRFELRARGGSLYIQDYSEYIISKTLAAPNTHWHHLE